MRDIPLEAIEDAARAIYDPVRAHPTVRLDVAGGLLAGIASR